MSCKLCGKDIPVTKTWRSYQLVDRVYAQATCNQCKRNRRSSAKEARTKVISDNIAKYFKDKK